MFNQSFIIAPQLKMVINKDDYLVFEGDKYGIVLSQMNPSTLRIETGLMEPAVAGWYSVDWRKIEQTSQLTFSQRGSAAHYLTRLQIFEKGKFDLDKFSRELPQVEDMMRLYAR